tara:strand:+ start:482 stop:676 length:195 start_codon:yes stop_codon:yes gene_type:complete
MTKQETAQQIVNQVLRFMVDNNYIDSWEINELNESGDIEQLQDIAQDSIGEFMGYVAKGTLRSK